MSKYSRHIKHRAKKAAHTRKYKSIMNSTMTRRNSRTARRNAVRTARRMTRSRRTPRNFIPPVIVSTHEAAVESPIIHESNSSPDISVISPPWSNNTPDAQFSSGTMDRTDVESITPFSQDEQSNNGSLHLSDLQ